MTSPAQPAKPGSNTAAAIFWIVVGLALLIYNVYGYVSTSRLSHQRLQRDADRERLYAQAVADARAGDDAKLIESASGFVRVARASNHAAQDAPRIDQINELLHAAVLRQVARLTSQGNTDAARQLLNAYATD